MAASDLATVFQELVAALPGAHYVATEQSDGTTIDVAATAPGVFTTDGSGNGQAWILNNDLTANGTGNGAAAGY